MKGCFSENNEGILIVENVKTDTFYGDEGEAYDKKDLVIPGLLSLTAFLLSLLGLLLLLLSHHVMACVVILTSFILIIVWQEKGQEKKQEKEREKEQQKEKV